MRSEGGGTSMLANFAHGFSKIVVYVLEAVIVGEKVGKIIVQGIGYS